MVVVVAGIYVLIDGWPEFTSWLSEYVVIAMLGFLLTYIGLTLAAFSFTPFDEVVAWAKKQKATFVGRYVVMNQPGGGVAMYFSAFALGLALLVLPRTDELANLLNPNALTGIVVLLVFLSWLVVAVTQSIDYLTSHYRLGRDVLVFPGTETPKYSDYLYFALGVSASFGPSDVSVRSAEIRRRMSLHTLVAFVFNTVILASVVAALSNTLS